MLKRVMLLVLLCVVAFSSLSLAAGQVNVLVWIGYMAPEVVENFQKANSGVQVNVKEYSTYEEMFALLKTGQYDVVITGELVIPTLISDGLLEPLDKNKIPNFKNIDPLFKGLSFDRENKYSLPYHYIYVGLVYNKQKLKASEVTLQNYFEAPAKYKGRLTTFPDKRIMVGMAMKYMGKSMNNLDKDNLELTKVLLKGLKNNLNEKGKNINRSVVDPYNEILSGEADIAISYCAESTRRLFKANDKIGFVLPREGAIIGVDNMSIVKNAKNKDMAHAFLNHFYDPKVAAISVNFFGNPFPVKGVKELIKSELASNPEIYPPVEVVKNLEFFVPMTEAQLANYDKVWAEVFGK